MGGSKGSDAKGGGKGASASPSGGGKAGGKGAGGKGPQQAAATPKAEATINGGKSDSEIQMAKELAEIRAWATQKGYPGADGGAATAADSEGDPNAKQKSDMDVLRADIANMQASTNKGAVVLGIIAEREKALECLRLEVRKSHPADIQLRNLAAKLAGVTKQREKHDEVADALAKEIAKLKTSMDEAAAAGAARRKEEEQLRRERLALVQQLEGEKVKEAKAVAGEQPETAHEVAEKLEYEEILRQFQGPEELKERMRVLRFGKKEPAVTAVVATAGSSPVAAEAVPPAAAAAPGEPGSGSGGTEDQSLVAKATEAAEVAAKRLAERAEENNTDMVDVGEGQGEQDRVRRRTGAN